MFSRTGDYKIGRWSKLVVVNSRRTNAHKFKIRAILSFLNYIRYNNSLMMNRIDKETFNIKSQVGRMIRFRPIRTMAYCSNLQQYLM